MNRNSGPCGGGGARTLEKFKIEAGAVQGDKNLPNRGGAGSIQFSKCRSLGERNLAEPRRLTFKIGYFYFFLR